MHYAHPTTNHLCALQAHTTIIPMEHTMCTSWTYGDLAGFTAQALSLDCDDTYCEHCSVIPITPGDRYCVKCTQEIVDYLAQVYKEQQACEEGLY